MENSKLHFFHGGVSFLSPCLEHLDMEEMETMVCISSCMHDTGS